MPRKSIETPRSQIVSALRQLWLRSRERSQAVQRDKNTCQVCNVKGSTAKGRECKTEVHHLQPEGVNWDRIVAVIRSELLCEPSALITLCKPCHLKVHAEGKI